MATSKEDGASRTPQCGGRREPVVLTRTELDVLAAFEDLSEELDGRGPTYAEMLVRLRWSPKSKGSLSQYVSRLRAKGVISGSGRSLRVVRD